MTDTLLPITDISKEGRLSYIDKYKVNVQLTLLQSMDSLEDDFATNDQFMNAFGSHDSAVDMIINLFLADGFNLEKAPARDLSLFSMPHYWLKYKTGGRLNTCVSYFGISEEVIDTELNGDPIDDHIEYLAEGLREFNQCVAPDMVGYWLMANKKLLNENGALNQFNLCYEDVEQKGSEGKKTRYKADACFRYLYLFLNIKPKLIDNGYIDAYENKYFVRGKNIPQYTSDQSEDHTKKKNVREVIRQIIDKIQEVDCECTVLQACLIRTMARKSLVDLYEFEPLYKREFGDKLKSLKQIQTACAEELI